MDNKREYEQTVAQFERMDRIRRIKKMLVVSLFSLLLVAVVLYAVRVERKITELSQVQNVVVLKNNEPVTENIDNTVSCDDNKNEESDETTESAPREEVVTSADFNGPHASDEAEVSTTQNDKSQVYYITKTGKKYHNADCSYLKSRIEITYDKIISEGYEPCSRCIR